MTTVYRMNFAQRYMPDVDYSVLFEHDYVAEIKQWFIDAGKAFYNKVKNFIINCYHHWESIVIMSLASIGVASLLGELPFMYVLPMWIEASMVTPVLSVLIILLLVKIMEWRVHKRAKRALA